MARSESQCVAADRALDAGQVTVGPAAAESFSSWVVLMARQSPGMLHRHVKPRELVTSEMITSQGLETAL